MTPYASTSLMERYAVKINVHPLSFRLGPHTNMRIKNTDDLNTLVLEISLLYSYTISACRWTMRSHYRCCFLGLLTCQCCPWFLHRMSDLLAYTKDGYCVMAQSFLSPPFFSHHSPRSHRGLAHMPAEKVSEGTILWVYCPLLSLSISVPHPDCFRERYPVIFWVGSQCKGPFLDAGSVIDLMASDLVPRPLE